MAMDFSSFVEYELDLATSNGACEVQVMQDPAGLSRCGVGSTVWDAGLVLAKYLERQTQEGKLDLQNKTVVELGAGTGIVGIALARLHPSCSVILTDKEDLLPLLKHNIDINNVTNAKAQVVDWTKTQPSDLEPDMILVSDGVWARDLHQPLADTIYSMAGAKTQVLLAFESRNFAEEAEFMALWSRHFAFHDIKPSEQHSVMKSEDIFLFVGHLK